MTKINIIFVIFDGIFAALNYGYVIYGINHNNRFYFGNLMAGIICTLGCIMQFI